MKRKQNGAGQSGSDKNKRGFAKKQSGAAKKQSGAAKKQSGTAKKQSGSTKAKASAGRAKEAKKRGGVADAFIQPEGRIEPDIDLTEGRSSGVKPEDIMDSMQSSVFIIFANLFEIIFDGINLWHLWGVDGLKLLCIFDFGFMIERRHIGIHFTILNLFVGISVGTCGDGF